MSIAKAYVRHFPEGSYGGEHKRIEVVVSGGEPAFTYEERVIDEQHTAYLGFDASGEIGSFMVSTPDKTGSGGATFRLRMRDGSLREVVGPWSSAASSINPLFGLDDPLVECCDQNLIVRHVRKSVLDRFGVAMEYRRYSARKGYWDAA